ncbi:UNVERIFIED_ORG: hypothetical protein EDC92_11414 [Dietzia maris]
MRTNGDFKLDSNETSHSTNVAGTSSRTSAWHSRRQLPLYAVITWWGVCFASYASGWPIEYGRANFVEVALMFGATAVLTVIGFQLGLNARVGGYSKGAAWWPAIGLVVSTVLFFPTVATSSALNLSELGTALSDQGTAYQETSDLFEQGVAGGAAVFLASILFAVFTLTVIPAYAVRAIDGDRRAILPLLVGVLPPLTLSVLTGRDQQFGVVVLLMVASWVIVVARRKSWTVFRASLLAIVVAAVTFLAMSYRRYQRLDGVDFCNPGQINCAENSAGFLAQSFRMFASYCSQGFEGLGRALDTTWSFGGGLSHSVPLDGLSSRLFAPRSAPTVTEQLDLVGWSASAYWSTALTQLANDLPWILVPVFVGVWAILLGFTWKLAVTRGDWLTVTIFAYSIYGFIFVPQNYQLGVTVPMYLGYILLIALLFYRIMTERSEKTRSRRRV